MSLYLICLFVLLCIFVDRRTEFSYNVRFFILSFVNVTTVNLNSLIHLPFIVFFFVFPLTVHRLTVSGDATSHVNGFKCKLDTRCYAVVYISQTEWNDPECSVLSSLNQFHKSRLALSSLTFSLTCKHLPWHGVRLWCLQLHTDRCWQIQF